MSNVSEVLGQKAIGWMNGLESLTKHYAPSVMDGAIQVIRISAIHNLLIWFALLIIWPLTGLKVWRLCQAESQKAMMAQNDFIIFFGGVYVFIACVGIVISIIGLLDVWDWIAVFDPKLAIAHLIFAKVAQ
jgi:hypothetical protein